MIVGVKLSHLKEGHWYEYAIRFVLGGLATVCAGLIAQSYGPLTGGLFLAFPAIFTASATIVEKHERQRKARQGLLGNERGKRSRLGILRCRTGQRWIGGICGGRLSRCDEEYLACFYCCNCGVDNSVLSHVACAQACSSFAV